MKKGLAFVLVVAAIWYAVTTNNQMTLLQQTSTRLSQAEEQLNAGNLKATNSLLIQIGVDLGSIDDQFYTFPSVRQTRQQVTVSEATLHTRFTQRLDLTKSAFNKVEDLLGSGDVKAALASAEASSQQFSDQDPTLVATVQYLKALNVQDFHGAGQAVTSITGTLPTELNVADIERVLSGFVESGRGENRDAQSRIASAAQPLIRADAARDSSSFTPVLKGRAMIWDFTKNDIDQAYELLPDDLRASSRDGTITIFLITKRENIELGRYSVSNQPAYQEKVTVGVVYWPEKASPGTATILGDLPPSSRPVTYSPGYGTAVNIRNWVSRLHQE